MDVLVGAEVVCGLPCVAAAVVGAFGPVVVVFGPLVGCGLPCGADGAFDFCAAAYAGASNSEPIATVPKIAFDMRMVLHQRGGASAVPAAMLRGM